MPSPTGGSVQGLQSAKQAVSSQAGRLQQRRQRGPGLREGLSLVLSATGFVLMLTLTIGSRPEGWLPEHDLDRWLCRELIERARGHEGDQDPSALALASWVLGAVPSPGTAFRAFALPALASPRAPSDLGYACFGVGDACVDGGWVPGRRGSDPGLR